MFTCTPLFLPYSIAFCIASTCDFDAPCGIATSKALLVMSSSWIVTPFQRCPLNLATWLIYPFNLEYKAFAFW